MEVSGACARPENKGLLLPQIPADRTQWIGRLSAESLKGLCEGMSLTGENRFFLHIKIISWSRFRKGNYFLTFWRTIEAYSLRKP